jgi:2-(1,2-epoxy-1,2-dihydrophenyl)acetyl-CoA isomerase
MAAGAGAGLAFACDLRIASDTAGFLMAFAKVGLTGDSGVTWTLPRLAGPLAAAELLMLAEPIDANRARQLGLVTDVVPAGELADRVATLANTLAAGPTTAYAAIKESLQFSAAHSLAETLEQEALLQARCGSTADHEAATRAFLAKQPVVFTGS